MRKSIKSKGKINIRHALYLSISTKQTKFKEFPS